MKKKEKIVDTEEYVNHVTGEVIEPGKLNQLIYHETRRKDGSLRIEEDYSNCPSLTEQHTAHLTDINYLIERHKPDELAAYLAARSTMRTPITGHDFSIEPDLQEAKNVNYRLKKSFEALPEEITRSFRNHVEFLKFIDNPANQEKMIKLGLMTRKQIEETPVIHKEKQNTETKNENNTENPK